MENITCYAENCKYNLAHCCTAREITIVSSKTPQNDDFPQETACENFEPKY